MGDTRASTTPPPTAPPDVRTHSAPTPPTPPADTTRTATASTPPPTDRTAWETSAPVSPPRTTSESAALTLDARAAGSPARSSTSKGTHKSTLDTAPSNTADSEDAPSNTVDSEDSEDAPAVDSARTACSETVWDGRGTTGVSRFK